MDELSVEQVAALRAWIRLATSKGQPLSLTDAQLKEKHGVTSADVMKPNGQDFARSMGQGLTLGHVDELAGLVAKARGKDYTQARDAMRTQDAEANAANPKMSGAVQLLSGAIPGVLSSAIPGLQSVAGATLGNAAKMAVQGGAVGALAGEGQSTANTAGGVTRDALVSSVLSAILAGVGGAMASKLATKGLPTGNTGAVLKESAGLLPNRTPDEIMQIVARQEQLAPGTTVAADISPEMQTLAKGVGADQRTAMAARKAAETRFRSLKQATTEMGKHYESLQGLKAPLDPDIVTAIAATGKKGIVPKGATEIDLGKIHALRSDILGQIREIKNPARIYDLRQQANGLTDWLQKAMPEIKGWDSDYAFLNQRTSVAKKTMEMINRSAANYGSARAYGTQSGSVGGSLPGVPLPGGGAGVTLKIVGKVLGATDRAARAQSVAEQLLTPTRTQEALRKILQVHATMSQPVDNSTINAGASALFGGVAPVAISQLLNQPQQ